MGHRAVNPTFISLESLMFMTYTHADDRNERQIWMNHDGDVTRDQWVDLGDVMHAAANGDSVVVADYTSEYVGDLMQFRLSVREFAPDGALVTQQVVMADTLPFGQLVAGSGFDDRDGVMTGMLIVVNALEDPVEYEMRAFRYDAGTDAVTLYEPAPVSVFPGSYVDWWAIDDGPPWAESLILAYHLVTSGGNGHFVYQSYDENLQLIGERTQDQPPNQYANGLEITLEYNTVYTAFTALSDDSLLRGCWLSGFPLEEILGAETRSPQPVEFALTSYPNPFNSTVRIRFTVPGEQVVTARIFDVTGREVERLAEDTWSPGSQELTWSARNAASGIYFARIEAGNFSGTAKMVLIK